MAFAPHGRLTFGGAIGPNVETWSCTMAIIEDETPGLNSGFDMTSDRFADCVADISAFMARATTGITSQAQLQWVKYADINAQGRYIGAPRIADGLAVNGAGSTVVTEFPPYQVSRKVTFHTTGDLGRVKGGFYLPTPTLTGFDGNLNVWSEAVTAAVTESVETLIEALNNQPGEDNDGFVVGVASQGRRNPDGSLRVPPSNFAVDYVHVGRRPDVQRRRAKNVAEAPPQRQEIDGE